MRFFFPLLAALSLTSTAMAQERTFPDNEALRQFSSINAPRLSPDGQRVLVNITDTTKDGGRSHLWLVDIEKRNFRQLTRTPTSKQDNKDGDDPGERAGEWMPDGETILFLAKRGEHTQLFRLSMQGGEAEPFDLKVPPPARSVSEEDMLPVSPDSKAEHQQAATEPLPLDIKGFSVAPDGNAIAVWAKDPETPQEKSQRESKADAIWVDHDRHLVRLYLLETSGGLLRPVAIPPEVDRVAWDNSSDRLCAEAEAPNGVADLGPARTVWMVQRADPQHPVKLEALPATTRYTAWSTDGRGLYFLAQAQQDTPPGYNDLYRYDFAERKVRNLSDGYAGSLAGRNPIPDADGTALELVQTGTRVTVARFTGKPPQSIDFGFPVVHELGTNLRHSGWVYVASGSTHPNSLYYTARLGTPAQELPLPGTTTLRSEVVASRLLKWNYEGRPLEALLYLPPSADAHHRVPLIVDVHGGPLGAWLDGYTPFINFLVGRGWAVLRPNPRGSTGYGPAFAASNKNDLGGGDYRDIMSGVDQALSKFPLDSTRLALIGYSYGGEMAAFVEGKTNRFKAIVSGAPVIDQFSEYGTEDNSWYDRWYFGKPWEHSVDAWRQSPLSGAGHATTPFLLLQGERDLTDPLGQAQEMYRALRQVGVPVDLVQYPREDHGPLAGGIFGQASTEPWHGFDARRRIVSFIDREFRKVQPCADCR